MRKLETFITGLAMCGVLLVPPLCAQEGGTSTKETPASARESAVQRDTLFSTSAVVGRKVKSLEGEEIGSVDDLLMDLQHGRIVYAILSIGGYLGIGGSHIAVPLSALQASPDHESYTLNASKDKLAATPKLGTDKAHWSSELVERERGAEVYKHYEQKPYWEEESMTESAQKSHDVADSAHQGDPQRRGSGQPGTEQSTP